MLMICKGSGIRLREAVRTVTDGTLSLLSRSLPPKVPNYSQNSKALEKSDSPTQASGSGGAYPKSTPVYYENPTGTNVTPSAPTYIHADNQMTHAQTPYPAATQYSTYSESASTIAYTPNETANAYTSYPANPDAIEAPLLAAFAAQASQVQAQNQGTNWQRSPQQAHSGSLAWQQWTNTMAGSLEPQDCYSASALMQLGGRELSNGQTGPAGESSAALTSIAINGRMNGIGIDQTQEGVAHLGGQVTNGMTWPLNIFDIGTAGASS